MRPCSILTTTNETYVPIVINLLDSFSKFHPEIHIFVSCVNVSEKSIQRLKSTNKNTSFLVENLKLDPLAEKNYCAHNRTLWLPKLMEEHKRDFFWLDADIMLKDNIGEFFEWVQDIDFCIRSKKNTPETFTCNCGMVWIKYSDKNLKIVNEWKDEADKLGLLTYWYADQESLNNVMHKHINILNDIKYETFPKKFNGIQTNEESIIIHFKGTKKLRST
tara:strand:+ start:212 stop:868 length:657 start_codon:yes stop_codon:yes gene_type:complete